MRQSHAVPWGEKDRAKWSHVGGDLPIRGRKRRRGGVALLTLYIGQVDPER